MPQHTEIQGIIRIDDTQHVVIFCHITVVEKQKGIPVSRDALAIVSSLYPLTLRLIA
jgi:hypothetical protein